MTDEIGSKTYTWQEAWKQAVTHPSVETFAHLKNDSTVSGNRAYKWIFMGGLIGSLPVSLICSPVVSIIALVCTAIYVLIISGIARCLRGTGTYKQLLFVMAAYMAPLGIISGLVTLSTKVIPLLGYLSLLLSLYGLLLSLIAVKAVHQVSWFKSLIANFFPPVIFIGSVVSLLFISSPQVGQEMVNQFMMAIKNKDFSQFYPNEESVITQEWPSGINQDLPVIKADELIALIQEVDNSITFKKIEDWGRTRGDKYDTTLHQYSESHGKISLYIQIINRSGEADFEWCQISIHYPEGEFELHEKQIASLYEKYFSGIVHKLVKKPGKVEEILSNKYLFQDVFERMENRLNPALFVFFDNYAYKIDQEEDHPSPDPPTEDSVVIDRSFDLFICRIDMYERRKK
ncbi:MAG: YIP1 family protein [Candidatus Electrothrix sp. AR4]|nr:YIP1 family protein [Candidatus Electrothrix sp. AR4]